MSSKQGEAIAVKEYILLNATDRVIVFPGKEAKDIVGKLTGDKISLPVSAGKILVRCGQAKEG